MTVRLCQSTRSGFERPFFRLATSGCIDDRTNIACFAVFARRKNDALSGQRSGMPTEPVIMLTHLCAALGHQTLVIARRNDAAIFNSIFHSQTTVPRRSASGFSNASSISFSSRVGFMAAGPRPGPSPRRQRSPPEMARARPLAHPLESRPHRRSSGQHPRRRSRPAVPVECRHPRA